MLSIPLGRLVSTTVDFTADPVVPRTTSDDHGQRTGRKVRMDVGYLLRTFVEKNRGRQPNHSYRTFLAAVNALHSSPLQKTIFLIDDGGSFCEIAHCHIPSLSNLAVHRRLFGGSRSSWLCHVLSRRTQPR